MIAHQNAETCQHSPSNSRPAINLNRKPGFNMPHAIKSIQKEKGQRKVRRKNGEEQSKTDEGAEGTSQDPDKLKTFCLIKWGKPILYINPCHIFINQCFFRTNAAHVYKQSYLRKDKILSGFTGTWKKILFPNTRLSTGVFSSGTRPVRRMLQLLLRWNMSPLHEE